MVNHRSEPTTVKSIVEEVLTFGCRFRARRETVFEVFEEVKKRAWLPAVEQDVSGRPCIPVEVKVR